MSTIYEVARAFRAQVLALDGDAAGRMLEAYAEAWRAIKLQLAKLDQDIKAARDRGEHIGAVWVARTKRLDALEQQIAEQIRVFAAVADQTIVAAQRAAVNAALNMTVDIGEAAKPGLGVGFAAPDPGALAHLVGTLGDGSPLKALLDKLPGEAAALAGKRLVAGVALGTPVRTVARQIRDDLGSINLTRSLTIARTEIMRSFREASLESYRANSQAIRGWVWTASMSERTCMMCISMHGTEHPLDEPFGSHPRCRCSPVPILMTEGLQQEIPSGESWFAKQSEKTQRFMLGPSKYDAYHDGRIALPDLVHYESDPDWGPQRREASLKQALANH